MGRQSRHPDSRRADEEAGVPQGANADPGSWGGRWWTESLWGAGGTWTPISVIRGAGSAALTRCLRKGNWRRRLCLDEKSPVIGVSCDLELGRSLSCSGHTSRLQSCLHCLREGTGLGGVGEHKMNTPQLPISLPRRSRSPRFLIRKMGRWWCLPQREK